MKTLKNYFYPIAVILFALLSVTFTSCSDDDDDSGSASDLVGTWERVSLTFQQKVNGIVTEEYTTNNIKFMTKFNADGSYETAEYYNNKWSWDVTGTWSYKNGKITCCIIEEDDIYYVTSTVKELTSSKFVVEGVDKYTENGKSYEEYYLEEYRKISE
ncbi:MAG: hypothetical protein ACI4V5_04645 [Prevotella sp.]